MKKLLSALILLFIITVFASCKKDSKDPDKTEETPLIQAIALTSRTGRTVFTYTYDDKKRLTSTGSNNKTNPITYNLGGFQIVNTYDAATKKIIDFNLEDGRINTAIYNEFVNDVNKNLPVNAAFSYDTKGRLTKIKQRITVDPYPPYQFRDLLYTFTWDDNDNLIASSTYDPNRPDSKYTVKYSGFAAENTNTLTGKNFGFDYWGTTSFTGDFYPGGDGSSGGILPFIYPGKILPTVWKVNNVTYKMTYHKNARGYIDRIEEVNAGDANEYVYSDIAYQ